MGSRGCDSIYVQNAVKTNTDNSQSGFIRRIFLHVHVEYEKTPMIHCIHICISIHITYLKIPQMGKPWGLVRVDLLKYACPQLFIF